MNNGAKWVYGKPSFIWMMVIELLLLNAISLVFLLHSQEAGYSSMFGGLIAWVSNVAFDLSAYRYSGAKEVHKMVKRVYQGEILKIGTAALLFAAVFYWVTAINIAALFSVFIFILVIHGFIAVFCAKRFGK